MTPPRRPLPTLLAFVAIAAAMPATARAGTPTAADAAICRNIAERMRPIAPMMPAEPPLRLAQATAPATPATDEGALADELAEMLQACSYDGTAVAVSTAALAAGQQGAGEAVVADIMRFTGLPQNFRVIEAAVPNAAAMIVLGPDGLPQRVIAYSAAFIERVRTATANDDWAAVSILAHEIGHHLSGHTLVPGGSQPPVELEADRFSGFVLFRMGAALADAQKAIATLVPVADGPTHPGRPKRLAAVEAGWTTSCGQAQGGCPETTVAAIKPATPPVAPATPSPAPASTAGAADAAPKPAGTRPSIADVRIPTVADIAMPKLPGRGEPPSGDTRNLVLDAALDTVPPLDPAATPGKFDRFVYDEVGVFDPAAKEALAKRAYTYAAANDVEIVTIIARDLRGRSADRYALDAMRQLRIGKLEVGNGAVLVVAPGTRETGVALGAGLAIRYGNTDDLRRYLTSYLDLVAGGAKPQRASDLIVDGSSRIMRDTQALEWAVRFPSLAAMQAEADAYRARQKAGEAYDPAKDPTWQKLLRVRATLVGTDPAKAGLDVNAVKQRRIGPALHIRTADGTDAVIYASPTVAALMPTALTPGQTYAFVLRDSFMATNAPQFDLISYDLWP